MSSKDQTPNREWESIIDEEYIVDEESNLLAELQQNLEEENLEQKRQLRVYKLLLGLSWLIFFNVFAFRELGSGTFVIGILELLILLIYMKVSGDEYLIEIYRDLLEAFQTVRGKDKK